VVLRSIAEKRMRRKDGPGSNAHRLANQMRRYFAPASTLPPPSSSGYGGRNTTATANNSQNTTPTDNAVIQFKAGKLVWRFKTNFQFTPTVTATAITANQNGPQELTLFTLASARNAGGGGGVIIQSSDPTDTRFVNLHAVANPT
jgi:hypothetical protein